MGNNNNNNKLPQLSPSGKELQKLESNRIIEL